jgi:AbrB family looped-hinge helix DNA binding protein
MTTATITSKGQIAIPKEVRDRLKLKAGTELVIDVQGESLILRRAVRELPHWSTMRGMAKGGESLTKALEEERAAENAHYDARINQGR